MVQRQPAHHHIVGLQGNGIGKVLIVEKIRKDNSIGTKGMIQGTIRQEAGRQEITIVAIPGRDDPLILVQRSCIEFWSDVTQV